jgi:hypothetical protein
MVAGLFPGVARPQVYPSQRNCECSESKNDSTQVDHVTRGHGWLLSDGAKLAEQTAKALDPGQSISMLSGSSGAPERPAT